MPYKSKKKNRAYMKGYMKEYRKMQQEAIRLARQMGFNTGVRNTQKKPKRPKRRR